MLTGWYDLRAPIRIQPCTPLNFNWNGTHRIENVRQICTDFWASTKNVDFSRLKSNHIGCWPSLSGLPIVLPNFLFDPLAACQSVKNSLFFPPLCLVPTPLLLFLSLYCEVDNDMLAPLCLASGAIPIKKYPRVRNEQTPSSWFKQRECRVNFPAAKNGQKVGVVIFDFVLPGSRPFLLAALHVPTLIWARIIYCHQSQQISPYSVRFQFLEKGSEGIPSIWNVEGLLSLCRISMKF